MPAATRLPARCSAGPKPTGSSHWPTGRRRRSSAVPTAFATTTTARPAWSSSTSVGGISAMTPATRWSSTGGRRCRTRSIKPQPPSREASRCGAGSFSPAAYLPRTRRRPHHGEPDRRGRRHRSAARTSGRGGDRAPTGGADARHRSHDRARSGRHRPGTAGDLAVHPKGHRGPGRPRSGCTAPPTCSTPIPTSCIVPASW